MFVLAQAPLKTSIRIEVFHAIPRAGAITISQRKCQNWMKNTVPFSWIHDEIRIINYRMLKTAQSIRCFSFKSRTNLQNWGTGIFDVQKTANPFEVLNAKLMKTLLCVKKYVLKCLRASWFQRSKAKCMLETRNCWCDSASFCTMICIENAQ